MLEGHIYDVTNSYRWAFLICLMVMAGALVIFMPLRPPKIETKQINPKKGI